MKPGIRNLRAVPVLVLTMALPLGCMSQTSGDAAPPGGAPTASDDDCTAARAWVEKPSRPDGTKFEATSNCSFHQWAYQTFLWLVSEAPGAGGALVFEGLANPKDLLKPGGPGATPYPGHAAGGPLTMLARLGKSRTTADIDEIFQAGPGNKVLVDQQANVVNYSNHLSEQYWDFVVEQRLYDVGVLKALDPKLDFPVDALELKSSWRIVQVDGEAPVVPDAGKRFHVVSAEVPKVAPNSRGVIEPVRDAAGKPVMIKARVALIGMHVVGVVKSHPEFIWATFEHVDNAPDCADIPPPAGTAARDWSLYDGKASRATANQFDLGNPMQPVSVCLTHPLGGGTAENQNAIRTLNAHVKALLGDSLWSHYRLGGAVWTSGQVPLNNGAFSPEDIDAAKGKPPTQLGSLELANTSMETFTQDQNCFACHNGGSHVIATGGSATTVNAKNVNLSHFVVNYQAARQVRGD